MVRLLIPKPDPDERERRRKKLSAEDRKGSREARYRSGGMCEVVFIGGGRCPRRATEVHHMDGRHREPGRWTTKEAKQHVCAECHHGITGEIGGKRLKPVQEGDVPMWSDEYERTS